MTTRRDFLSCAAAIAGMPLLGWAGEPPSAAGAAELPVLVVLQLSGGNDGLNTVVPWRDDAYRRARPGLALAEGGLHKLAGKDLALHPALGELAHVFATGELAIINGVGYPQPDRSHFRSLDIWHSGRREELLGDAARTPESGWLGRCLDERRAALHIGDGRQPLALTGSRPVPSLGDLDALTRLGADGAARAVLAAAQTGVRTNAGLERTRALGETTLAQVDLILALSRKPVPVEYPGDDLGRRLRLAGQLIAGGFGNRMYYLSQDGYDTHANQRDAHAALLSSLGRSVQAFAAHLRATGAWRRTTLLIFSEFGRRVTENGSFGTDHGAAGPTLLAGGRVQGGIHGAHPSLTALDEGDLIHHTDFRRIYATLLREVLDLDPQPILGGDHAPLPLLG